MRRLLVHQAWILLAAGVAFCTNLGGPALWDEDEPQYASCAREMIARGDWVVPLYNGELFCEKPPLVYWSIIGGFKLFGAGELGARFWSAIFGLGTALMTYHLGRRLFGPEAGLWAGLAVASCLLFTITARAATADSALVFFTTAALTLFVTGGIARASETTSSFANGPSDAGPTRRPRFLPDGWIRFVLIYACLGVAVLGNGPVELFAPCVAIGLFLMVMNRRAERNAEAVAGGPRRKNAWIVRLSGLFGPRNVLRSLWQMRPVTGLVVLAVVALPWYVLVGVRTDGIWIEQFFQRSNWDAFAGSHQGHPGPLLYYMPATMIGFFPWSVLLIPAVVELVRRIRRGHARHAAYVLAACWVSVYFGFWSLCGARLPHHLLPIYPILAVLVGAYVRDWITQPVPADRRRLRTALGLVMVAGLGMAVVLPIVASIYAPGEEILGLLGLILLVGGAAALYLAERQRRQPAAVLMALMSVAFVTAIFGFASLRVDRHQVAKPLVAELERLGPGEPQLAGYRFIRESLVFYSGRPMQICRSGEELRQFLDGAECPCVITVDSCESAVEELFGDELTVVARRPRFLRAGEIVVFARPAHSTPGRVAARISADTLQ